MSRRSLLACAALATTAASLAGAPCAVAQSLELWAGAGAAQPLVQPGPDREMGPALLGAAEVSRGSLPLRLRLEAGFASQELHTRRGGLISGDIQTVHAALAGRLPLRGSDAAASPYLLGGAALLRHSTRTKLRSSDVSVPDARFVATSSEVVPGAMAGVGLGWRIASVRGFAELRWIYSSTAGERTSSLPLVAGLRLPVRR